MDEHQETDPHKEKYNELQEKTDDEHVQDVLKRIERQKDLKIEQ